MKLKMAMSFQGKKKQILMCFSVSQFQGTLGFQSGKLKLRAFLIDLHKTARPPGTCLLGKIKRAPSEREKLPVQAGNGLLDAPESLHA